MDVIKGDGNKVVSLKNNRWRKSKCEHLHLVVYEYDLVIECEDCGERIEPFYAVLLFSRKQTRVSQMIGNLRKREEAFAKKTKVKCKHCGRFTQVNV